MLRRSVVEAVRRGGVRVHDDRGAVAHVVAGLWIARGVPRRARARAWNGARTSAASVLCLPALAGQWGVPFTVRLVVHYLEPLRGRVQGCQRERHGGRERSQWRCPSGSGGGGGGGGYDAWDVAIAQRGPGSGARVVCAVLARAGREVVPATVRARLAATHVALCESLCRVPATSLGIEARASLRHRTPESRSRTVPARTRVSEVARTGPA